jgi:maltose/maltodextrin transport system substrate-binding protein
MEAVSSSQVESRRRRAPLASDRINRVRSRRLARRCVPDDTPHHRGHSINHLIANVLAAATLSLSLSLSSAAFAFEEGKLVLWINGDKGHNGLTRLGERFTKDTGIAVEVSHPDSVEQRFQQLASNAQGPDIMFWAHDRLGAWVKGGLLAPLDPSPEVKAAIEDFAWDAVTVDAKIYGYPVAVEAIALIYNKDLMPDGPAATFEEMIELDTRLKAEHKHAILWAYESPYFTYPLLSANGGYAFKRHPDGGYDVGDTGLNNAGAKQGAAFLADMIDKGHLPRGLDYGIAEAKFNQGEAAMTINGPWAWDSLRKSGLNYGVAPLPSLGGRPTRAFVGVFAGVINNASPNKDLAVRFLEEYLLTPEGLAMVNDDKPLGAVPLKAYQAELAKDGRIAVTFENAKNGEPMPSVPEMIKFWTNLKGALMNIAAGRQGVEEALDAAARRTLE